MGIDTVYEQDMQTAHIIQPAEEMAAIIQQFDNIVIVAHGSPDIEYTFHAFCKVVIRNATINAARTRSRKHKREISLEYLTDEKHYPLGTTDEYFQAPEPDEEYILTLCGDTVIFSSGLLAEALSRLDEREREMIYLSFFKRIPQHEIGRQYGRSRSTAGYHIRKALRQLQAEMEGMAYEK